MERCRRMTKRLGLLRCCRGARMARWTRHSPSSSALRRSSTFEKSGTFCFAHYRSDHHANSVCVFPTSGSSKTSTSSRASPRRMVGPTVLGPSRFYDHHFGARRGGTPPHCSLGHVAFRTISLKCGRKNQKEYKPVDVWRPYLKHTDGRVITAQHRAWMDTAGVCMWCARLIHCRTTDPLPHC